MDHTFKLEVKPQYLALLVFPFLHLYTHSGKIAEPPYTPSILIGVRNQPSTFQQSLPSWSWESMKDKHEQITTQINRNGHTVVSYVKKRESSYCRWWFKKTLVYGIRGYLLEKNVIKLRPNEQIRNFWDKEKKKKHGWVFQETQE